MRTFAAFHRPILATRSTSFCFNLIRGSECSKCVPMLAFDTRSTTERKVIDFRPLRITGALVLGRYHYTGAHPGLRSHRHEKSLEICYLAKGEQTYRVGAEDFHLRGGDLFLTFPNEPHSTGQAPEGKGDLYWLILDTQPRRNTFLDCTRGEGRALLQTLL